MSLSFVQNRQRELRDVGSGVKANPATDAEARGVRSGQVEGTPGNVINSVGVREVAELGIAQGLDGPKEAEAPRGFRQVLESLEEPISVRRHDGAQDHGGPIAEVKPEKGRRHKGGGSGEYPTPMSQEVSIATERIRFSLRGTFADATEGLAVRSLRGEPITVEGSGTGGLVEETTYTVWAESLSAEPIQILHADPVVTAALRSENQGQIVTGTLHFGSHVGRTRFLALVGGRVELEMVAEVTPRKVTWDLVEIMRDEVDAAWAGLPLSALRPTHASRSANDSDGPSVPAWVALLQSSSEALDAALREIRRRPLQDVARPRQRVRASRATGADAVARASVRRAGGLPEVIEARPPHLTLDTPSHRWLAARLRRVASTLRRLIQEETSRPATDRRRVVIETLRQIHRQLERHRVRGPLAEVSTRASSIPPLALRRRPAYATAYHALRQLDGGLARAEGEVRPSLLDLAGLYEAWCALALVRETAAALNVEPPAMPFGLQRAGVDVRLRRGRASAVRLSGKGVQVDMVYSPRFASPKALLAQRPDFLLTVRGRSTRRIVLDAKYRRHDQSARYGVSGPPADAIGALHRYRDAILGPNGAAGWIHGAVALFPPGPDAASFGTSQLWTGLADIGIGAIPLVPEQTVWLRRWIEQTIREVA